MATTKTSPRRHKGAKAHEASQVRSFAPDRVKPFAGQPRKRFKDIDALAKSITAVGQLIPGKVILLPNDKHFDAQLIDGLRACQKAGVNFRAEIETRHREDAELFEESLAANFGKQDHDCLEIAEALGKLKAKGRTLAQMADLCGGKSMGWVHLQLLQLAPAVREMLIQEEDPLPMYIAILLVEMPADEQLDWAEKLRGRSMAEARRMVLKVRHARGAKSTLRAHRPSAGFEGLAALVRDSEARLGVFVDLPREQYDAILRAGSVDEARALEEKIGDLFETVSNDLAKSLKKRGVAA